MTKTNKSSDTRDQLRRLMSQHTAATAARPGSSVPSKSPAHVIPTREVVHAPLPVTAPTPPVAHSVKSPAPMAALKPMAGGERCTLRLAAAELARIDRLILETHQRVGERITTSDVLRIGLARVTNTSPIAAAEIAALRATDGRRIKHLG